MRAVMAMVMRPMKAMKALSNDGHGNESYVNRPIRTVIDMAMDQ